MSESSNSTPLIQVTSTDILLNDNMRITWQGFRPVDATDPKPSTYFTTLPGDGTGETQISMIALGAQAKDHTVEITLLSGAAFLNGVPMGINVPVTIPATNTGEEANLLYTTETVSLQASPQWPQTKADLMQDGTGNQPPPPPPLPGNGSDD
jgi:hypothetical protein